MAGRRRGGASALVYLAPIVGVAVIYAVTRPARPREIATPAEIRPAAPSLSLTADQRAFFGEALSGWAEVLEATKADAVDERVALMQVADRRLEAAAERAGLPLEVRESLRAAIALIRRAIVGGREFLVDADAVDAAIGKLSTSLADAGIPVAIDGALLEIGGGRIFGWELFAVVDSIVCQSSEGQVHVRRVRRFDGAPASASLLGLTRPGGRDPLLFLDAIEALSAEQIDPALDGKSLPLSDDRTPYDQRGELEVRGGELARALGQPGWAVIDMTARHETRHRLDYTAGAQKLLAPEPLAALLVGVPDDDPHSEAARLELRAYLADLVYVPERSGFLLLFMARGLVEPTLHGTATSLAAVVIVEEVARELGVPRAPLVVDHRIDRAAVARTLLAAAARPSTEIAAAAARVWARLYGDDVHPIDCH